MVNNNIHRFKLGYNIFIQYIKEEEYKIVGSRNIQHKKNKYRFIIVSFKNYHLRPTLSLKCEKHLIKSYSPFLNWLYILFIVSLTSYIRFSL